MVVSVARAVFKGAVIYSLLSRQLELCIQVLGRLIKSETTAWFSDLVERWRSLIDSREQQTQLRLLDIHCHYGIDKSYPRDCQSHGDSKLVTTFWRRKQFCNVGTGHLLRILLGLRTLSITLQLQLCCEKWSSLRCTRQQVQHSNSRATRTTFNNHSHHLLHCILLINLHILHWWNSET